MEQGTHCPGKRRIAALIVAMVAVSMLWGACSKYDEDDNYRYMDYGTVWFYDRGNVTDYYIERDDGVRLHIRSDLSPKEVSVVGGQRVKFFYDILDSETEAREQIYGIKLFGIYGILDKQPIARSFIAEDIEHREDSIGDDPLARVRNVWLTDRYLNVVCTYPRRPGSEQTHRINLVVDDTAPDSDGVLRLHLRHNGGKESPRGTELGFMEYETVVSFDISELADGGQLPLRVYWTEYGDGWGETVSRSSEQGIYSAGSKGRSYLYGPPMGRYSRMELQERNLIGDIE